MLTGLAPTTLAQQHKNRLEVVYIGHGSATVFNNGQVIPAIWTKKGEHTPTIITYAGGPDKGKQIPMVRGQIFVQVVPSGVTASWTPGTLLPPQIAP